MMSAVTDHEECWLLLPWLANGRLGPAERARAEEHVRGCAACAGELAQQRLTCRALSAPDRVTYAPGPSFRKLMDRIDGRPAARRTPERRTARLPGRPSAGAALWRPPGLAWAASFLAMIGLAAVTATAYRWSLPLYGTYTSAATSEPTVLHVAFQRSLPIGQVEELLRSAGASVVEGPDASGIFGVTPVAPDGLRSLAQRLRADARVRWVQPLGAAEPRADAVQGSGAQEQ